MSTLIPATVVVSSPLSEKELGALKGVSRVSDQASRETDEILERERLHFSRGNATPEISMEDFLLHCIFAIDTRAYNFHKMTTMGKTESRHLILAEVVQLYSQEKIQPIPPSELSEALVGNILFHLDSDQESQFKKTLERIIFTQI